MLGVLISLCTNPSFAFLDSLWKRQLTWRIETGYLTPPKIPNSIFDSQFAIVGMSRIHFGIGPVLKINDNWRVNTVCIYNHQFINQRFFFAGIVDANANNFVKHSLDEIMISVGLEKRIAGDGKSEVFFHSAFQPWYYLCSKFIGKDKRITDGISYFQSRIISYPPQRIQFAVNLGIGYRFTGKKINRGFDLDLQLRQNASIPYYYVVDGWFTYSDFYSTSSPYLGFSTFLEL